MGRFNPWKCQTNEGLTVIASLGVTSSNIFVIIHKSAIISFLQTFQTLYSCVPGLAGKMLMESLCGGDGPIPISSPLRPLWFLEAALGDSFNPTLNGCKLPFQRWFPLRSILPKSSLYTSHSQAAPTVGTQPIREAAIYLLTTPDLTNHTLNLWDTQILTTRKLNTIHCLQEV